ncbi:MAG: hybrid sensor histidine kinase/response regulator [Bacteroidales bacterium]
MEKNISSKQVSAVILVVDDNPQNLQVLGNLLQDNQYEIEFATSGKAALEWLKVQKFDLILLDIKMPKMDGYEVCKKIRSDKKMNNVPVIFLSSDKDRESILKGFDAGAQDYLTKPYDRRELIVRVQTHLKLKNSLETLEKLNESLERRVRERTRQLNIANYELRNMNLRLSELDNAKSQFLNLISHEIRIPLDGIILPLQLLKEPFSESDSGELLNILDSSVKRLEKFAMNALLITKLKTKPYEISEERADITKLIREVIREEKTEIDKKHLTIKVKTGGHACIIPGQINLLKKCISNIIDNSIAFSPNDGFIEVNVHIDGLYLVVEINDFGEGIPEEIIKKGTKPFSPGKKYRDKSTGIGLPLSKLIMNAHNGLMELKNRPGGGASVILRLRMSRIYV